MTAHNSKPKSLFRWLGILCCVAALAALPMQWQIISELRNANDSLRLELKSRAETPIKPAAVSQDSEQSLKDVSELARLRNEVRQLREQVALLKSGEHEAAVPPSNPAATAQPPGGGISQLASAATAGDLTALKKLAELSAAAHAQFGTNQDAEVFAELRSAFNAIGAQAGKGNETALGALLAASRMDYLGGFAVDALGQAAGQGNERALEPLLDPERYFILQSSAVGALKPAADAGNPRAIQALATVAGDVNLQPLWFMTADGLRGAAQAGNATAIEALAALVRSDNQSVRRTAFTALETAAIDHPRAAEALRRLYGQ